MRHVWYLKHTDSDGGFNYLRDIVPEWEALMKASLVPEPDMERGPVTEFLSYADAWAIQQLMDHRGVTGWEIEGPFPVR